MSEIVVNLENEVGIENILAVMRVVERMGQVDGVLGGAVEGQRAADGGFVKLFEKMVVARVRELTLGLANGEDGRCDNLLMSLQNVMRLYFGQRGEAGIVGRKLNEVKMERGDSGVGRGAREEAMSELEGSEGKRGWEGIADPWQKRVNAVAGEMISDIFPNPSQIPAGLRAEWQIILDDMSSKLTSPRANVDDDIVKEVYRIAGKFMDEEISNDKGWMRDWNMRWTGVLKELAKI